MAVFLMFVCIIIIKAQKKITTVLDLLRQRGPTRILTTYGVLCQTLTVIRVPPSNRWMDILTTYVVKLRQEDSSKARGFYERLKGVKEDMNEISIDPAYIKCKGDLVANSC